MWGLVSTWFGIPTSKLGMGLCAEVDMHGLAPNFQAYLLGRVCGDWLRLGSKGKRVVQVRPYGPGHVPLVHS